MDRCILIYFKGVVVKPNIVNHGKCFGNDNWYMFYCGNCSTTIDMNLKKEDRLFCDHCTEPIDYPKDKEKQK